MTGPTTQFHQITRRTLAANIMTLFSGSAISQGLTAVALLLIARQVGPESYGQYVGAIVLATFLSMFFSLGLDTWLLREGGSQPERLGETAGSLLGLKLGLGVVWLAALALAAQLLNRYYDPQILTLAALTVWLDSILNTFQAIFKSALLNRLTAGIIVSSDLAWMLATLWLYSRGELAIEPYMHVRITVLAVTLLAAYGFLKLRVKPRVSAAVLRRIRQEFPPFAVSEILILALLRADILIISFSLGKAAVGYYSPAVSLINAIYLVPNSLHGVFLPVLSNIFHNNHERGWKVGWAVVGVQASIGLFLNAAIFFISPFLIGLLGPEYAASIRILKILSFNLVFHGISYALVAILLANNLQVKRTVLQGLAVLVNIVINLIVIHWLGIQGVALVYVVTEAILAGGYTVVAYNLWRNRKETIGHPN